jgi:RimJ/RimL family protein N-acetyltransferase
MLFIRFGGLQFFNKRFRIEVMNKKESINNFRLKSSKFMLRPFRRGDEVSLAKNINDKIIARNTLNIPHPYTIEGAMKWVDKNLREGKKKKPGMMNFVIEIGGEVAGSVGFNEIKNHKAEIGYWLARKYWNGGIMTQAVQLLVQFGFKKLRLRRIYAFVFTFNSASVAVLKKSGFKLEGILKKHAKKGTKLFDNYLFAKTC